MPRLVAACLTGRLPACLPNWLACWALQAEFLRMTTTQAAQEVPDDSLDFIYVDARQAPWLHAVRGWAEQEV